MQSHIAGSSKGRTSLSESENFGSIPSPAATHKKHIVNMTVCFLCVAKGSTRSVRLGIERRSDVSAPARTARRWPARDERRRGER